MTWTAVLLGVLVAFAFFLVSTGVVMFLIVRLPADRFCDSHFPTPHADCHPAWVWTVRIAKNLAGGAAVVLGIALSLPGIPGPGLALILIGVAMLDFPGKRRLERAILARPRVLRSLNSLRARFGKPPLVLDPALTETCQASQTKEGSNA